MFSRAQPLGEGQLEAGAYSQVKLILDYESDADGNAPGCYVLTDDNEKIALSSSSGSIGSITLQNSDFTVSEEGFTELVLDFDLRKAIMRAGEDLDNDGDKDSYGFVSEAERRSAIRLAEKGRTGMAEGQCENAYTFTDKVVVYAYTEGSFNKNVETNDGDGDGIRFENAVSSALVAEDGSYELHFLEEGEYELYFAGYEEEDDGQFELEGGLELDITGALNLGAVDIKANSGTELNVLITGIIPL